MTIKQVLEHVWIQKSIGTNLPEIRKNSKDKKNSNFQIYSTINDNFVKKNVKFEECLNKI